MKANHISLQFFLTGLVFVVKDTPVLMLKAFVETFCIVNFSRNVMKIE